MKILHPILIAVILLASFVFPLIQSERAEATVVNQTWSVGAGTDDCYRKLGSPDWSITGALYAGGFNGTHKQFGTGVRFTNIIIPQGTTILSAKLQFKASNNQAANTVNTRISAEDVNDAATFADNAAAFDARFATHTTARVDWDSIGAWVNSTWYDSVDITTVIQEIIDRGGWVSGNDMVLFWEDFDNRSAGVEDFRRIAYGYESGVGNAAKLYIEWDALEPPSVTSSAATIIGATTARLNGNVTVAGTDNPTVTLYWGLADEGTNAGAWSNNSSPTSPAQPQGVAAFYKDVTTLSPGTTYYFTAKATNSDGTSWSATQTFTTLQTYLVLYVDGVEKGDTALGSTSVPNSTANWTMLEGDTVYYSGNVTYAQGGATIDIWTWRWASTFIGNTTGNIATPSWRSASSDPDVSANLTSFFPVSEARAPAFVVGAGPDFLSSNITMSGNFTTGNTTGVDYPGRSVLLQLTGQTGVPYQIPSTFIATFLIIVASMMVSWFMRNYASMSFFVKSIVNGAGYGICVSLAVFDWWMIIFFLIFEVSFWFAVAERK